MMWRILMRMELPHNVRIPNPILYLQTNHENRSLHRWVFNFLPITMMHHLLTNAQSSLFVIHGDDDNAPGLPVLE
jgi:hypothetical protein